MTRASDTARLLGAGATILDGTTISTADNTDQLSLVSTDTDASVGPVLNLQRDSSSPADDDAMGTIDFRGENSASEIINYVRLNGRSADVTDSTEDGKFDINTYQSGASVNRLSLTPTETVFNEDSKDIDFRVESNGNANMLFVDGGNDAVGIGTNSPDHNLQIEDTSSNISLALTSSTSGFSRVIFGDSGSATIGAVTYRNSDNSMAFEANGSERMRIDSSGNLGLGATSIDSDIHIEKSSDLEIKLERTNSGTSTIGVPSSGQLLINNTSNADMIFSTNNTERFRVKNSGNFLVGTTDQSPAEGTGVGVRIGSNGTSQFSSSGDAGLSVNRTSDDGNVMTFRRDGNLRGRIEAGSSSVSYITTSDYRMKENISYDFDATTKIKQLKPCEFNWIADENNTTIVGFIAHELENDVSYACSGKKDAVEKYTDENGDEKTRIDPQGVDQSKLVPLLVKTIQELETRITTLEGA